MMRYCTQSNALMNKLHKALKVAIETTKFTPFLTLSVTFSL